MQAFKTTKDRTGQDRLFQAIEDYFEAGISGEEIGAKVCCTALAPIYFQYPGHSLTIIGFERQMNGQANLIVFDPSLKDSNKVQRLVGKDLKVRGDAADGILEAYRRGSKRLERFHEFEVL